MTSLKAIVHTTTPQSTYLLDAFIDEFKTYENLLNEIKNEYEATFLEQRAEIERLLPFKSKWTIAEYESSRSIEQIRSDNHRTTKNLM